MTFSVHLALKAHGATSAKAATPFYKKGNSMSLVKEGMQGFTGKAGDR